MKHDGTLQIATGLTVKSKVWKNKKYLWSSIVEKLSKAKYTGETAKQYHNASKAEKSKIKDVGGYVGGYLRKGRRKQQNVVSRQLITLDLDYAHLQFWDDFILNYNNAAVLHSTHSHTEDDPRYRLIMPLARDVSPDEYAAVSRRVAGNLNIELFDNTGFQTHRLMFWPSMPSDVEYYYKVQDGPWLDPDDVLESYIDWKDSSLWPTAASHLDDVERLSNKQQDPEFKKGIVGAFCRTYSITDVIEEFLKDEYSATAIPDRYTYINGSTAAGLIVYEDKFAYSHHGTDPCSGKLCNAFDLVRIHMFGHMDVDGGLSESRTQSYKAMEEFARQDPEVKGVIALEKFSTAKWEFEEELEDVEIENIDWAKELQVDARGNYLSSATNLNIIFSNDPHLKDLFTFNVFDNKRYIIRTAPWRKLEQPEPIRNIDYSGIRNYIETIYGIVGSLKIDDALALEFEKKSFHPIKDFLKPLKWDKVKRLDTVLIDYFGVKDNIYTREAIRKTLVAAIARIYKPGTKYDLVLTLVGDQGTGKSTFVNKLGIGWSSDTFMTVHGKDAFEQLQGAWLIEIAELSGLRKAEVEAIKHFISKQEDTYRPAYARSTETYKRQCVFIGTTNNKGFLRDPSGNRRFMPVDIRPMFATKSIFEIETETIEQIWAEAKHLYKKKEKLYLGQEAEKIAKVEQGRHREIDERAGLVHKYLNVLLPKNWDNMDEFERQIYLDEPKNGKYQRQYVCVAEIWAECLGKEKTAMDRYKTRELNELMRGLDGWEQSSSTRKFKIYGVQKYYKRIENEN